MNVNSERLNRIWRNMRQRCYNPNRNDYKHYGGRGINICSAWGEYAKFKKWALENGYTSELTLERINNNGDYSPENCRWIPFPEQRANTSQTRIITINNESKPLKYWCEDYGISYHAVCQRIHRGMDEISALLIPIRR